MVILTLLACAAPATAQVRPPSLAAPSPEPPSPVGVMVLGGIGGGAIGLLAGGYLGAALETARCGGEPFCGLAGTIFGGIAGEVLMLPLGVHLANGSRGRYLPAALASAAVGVAGLLVVAAAENASDRAGMAVAIAVPVAQIATAISIERSTHRARRHRPTTVPSRPHP